MDKQLNVEPINLDEQIAWVENQIEASQGRRDWLFDNNKTHMEIYHQTLGCPSWTWTSSQPHSSARDLDLPSVFLHDPGDLVCGRRLLKLLVCRKSGPSQSVQ